MHIYLPTYPPIYLPTYLPTYQAAGKLGSGHTIVTILCDGGERYRHHVYNDTTLQAKGLLPTNGPLRIKGLPPLPLEVGR